MKSKIIKLIGIYEIIGGIWGESTVIMDFFTRLGSYQVLTLLISIFLLILYALIVIGGFLLLREKKKGIIISSIVQGFQIPYIAASNCIYWISAGLQFIIRTTIEPHKIKIDERWFFGCFSRLFYESNITYVMLGINFIPIIIMLYLWKIQKNTSTNQLENKKSLENSI